jgi:hypothetical protein
MVRFRVGKFGGIVVGAPSLALRLDATLRRPFDFDRDCLAVAGHRRNITVRPQADN